MFAYFTLEINLMNCRADIVLVLRFVFNFKTTALFDCESQKGNLTYSLAAYLTYGAQVRCNSVGYESSNRSALAVLLISGELI